MTPPSNDRPELTAYALGELQTDQAHQVNGLLTEPGSATELEQIEAVTDALRHGAPIVHHRLTPEQRHAVLRPAHLPRLMQPMMPRPPVPRRAPKFGPVFVQLAQLAALIALTGLAFVVGQHFADKEQTVAVVPEDTEVINRIDEAKAAHEPQSPAASGATVAAVEKKAPVAAPAPKVGEKVSVNPVVASAQSKTAAVSQPAPPATAKPQPVSPPKPPPVVAKAAQEAPKQSKSPVGTNAVAFGLTTPAGSDAFVSASKQPSGEFNLRPANIRPAPVKPAGQQFASPVPANASIGAKDKEVPGAKSRTPDLYIHSWKAEVASCPWNEANRLLRVVVQLPADQPAATAGAAYPLQIAFDPKNVREYRLLCERHVPAAEVRTAGVHVIWYEFQPNGGADVARDATKPIATVTLPNGRFTTQTVGPFDSSKLQVMDRGVTWQNAREDFVFETAIVGFGMLLRGTEQTGALNHDLVLALADKGKGNDTTGDRTKFIRLVQTASKAAGL